MEMKCLSLKDLISVRKIKTGSDDTDTMNEQKENICMERRIMTPLKSDSLTGHRRVCSPDITHITPIKHPEKSHPDPWTPTANLKMLISAASPDIRDRELKKTLFRPIENEEKVTEEDDDLDDTCQFEVLDDSERRPSRKQKSLGLLCQKFLALYPDYPEPSESINISLDEVATCLGVERRRIYDIVNVLESLLLVSRMAKNLYVWHGRSLLSKTLEELERTGREQGYHLLMDQREGSSPHAAQHTQNTHVASSRRKDKSLRIMSQKFVMLFLVSKTRTVTLDTAAKILIEEGQDDSSHSKYKTKVRRLYDIANVLTSLNLIKKLHVREENSRKPIFKWIGPSDFRSDSESLEVSGTHTVTGTAERREKMVRHSSFQVVPTPHVNRRLINSAPSTPHRDGKDEPVDFSRKSVSSVACRLQFEDSPRAPSAGSTSVAVSLQPETPYTAQFTPQTVAYLPQTPVLMLYSSHVPEGIIQGQRSPITDQKRAREEDENQAVKRRKHSSSIESETAESECLDTREGSSGNEKEDGVEKRSNTDPHHSSQYLYVSNTAGLNGLNGLNFLMPAGHTHGGMSAVAVPYFLVPSPLMASTGPTSRAEGAAGGNLSFSMPTVLSPARFVMAGGAFGMSDKVNNAEHHGYRGPGSTLSPQGLRKESPRLVQMQTPSTPKEAAMWSKSFFETPGAFGLLASPPAARKRGSAQRKLDIEHSSN
ncbi:Transcription factor E2F7 [Triplophysa tibetana]|uniref:Transcription factor E2F7 n=1 Tax=Triplophysa tibetana TaxID=1572043 RepID=A0A5A9PEG1_9TELE|nr:Transcription factor E2F7 [Triplophysa tibetana]